MFLYLTFLASLSYTLCSFFDVVESSQITNQSEKILAQAYEFGDCENIQLPPTSGSFHNPGYPHNYINGSSCSWYILPSSGHIVIRFDDLDIVTGETFCNHENTPCCQNSAITITSNNTKELYCGQSNDVNNKMIFNTFISAGHRVDINFKGLFRHKSGRGFHATYRIVRNMTKCEKEEWKCSNGLCIPNIWRCNRRNECGDGSDENGCAFFCEGSTGTRCGDLNQCYTFPNERCDGTWHCKNGKDEENCSECAKDSYLCSSGKVCYTKSKRCDGHPECENFKDELDCNFCEPGKIPCEQNSRECYDPFTQKCNGEEDCSNGIDEKDCNRCANNLLCSSKCSSEDDCIKNSAITAALIGSLICGLLVVVAVGATRRLMALRQMEPVLNSPSPFIYPQNYHRYLPFRGSYGPPSFPEHNYFYREPPPSYSVAVSDSNCQRERQRRRRRPSTPPIESPIVQASGSTNETANNREEDKLKSDDESIPTEGSLPTPQTVNIELNSIQSLHVDCDEQPLLS